MASYAAGAPRLFVDDLMQAESFILAEKHQAQSLTFQYATALLKPTPLLLLAVIRICKVRR